MGSISKQKGASFERLICEKFSRWVEPKTDRTLFWRSSMSGGRGTIRRRTGKKEDLSSDLCAIAAQGHLLTNTYSIECKHVKNLNLTGLILGGHGDLPTFWRQVCRDAAHTSKKPLLIARQNSRAIIVLIRHDDLAFFGHVYGYVRARLYHLARYGSAVDLILFDDLLRGKYDPSFVHS